MVSSTEFLCGPLVELPGDGIELPLSESGQFCEAREVLA